MTDEVLGQWMAERSCAANFMRRTTMCDHLILDFENLKFS